MTYYRLYFMDARSGHIEHYCVIEADDDARAIRLANGHYSGAPMELWDEKRRVQRFEALPIVPSTDRA